MPRVGICAGCRRSRYLNITASATNACLLCNPQRSKVAAVRGKGLGTANTLEARVLQRAVELLGSERLVARRLRISQEDLGIFLQGAAKPTRAVFLAAVDLLIDRGEASAQRLR